MSFVYRSGWTVFVVGEKPNTMSKTQYSEEFIVKINVVINQ